MTTEKTMLAYNSDKKLKKSIVSIMKAHYEADEIIHGTYWEAGKGCAVGCSIDAINKTMGTRHDYGEHDKSETIGIPQSLYRLQDSIFEGLSNGASQKFPLDFANAIRPGADLSKVTAQFLVWCLLDKKHGAIRQAPKDKFADCHNAILSAAAIWQSYIKTGKIDEAAAESAAWSAARSAESAAASAARSAESAAESAAASAAWSAESAAESAAASAARSAESAAWSAARSAESAARSAKQNFWKAAAATLIKLLKKA